jgi:hypothetical protein
MEITAVTFISSRAADVHIENTVLSICNDQSAAYIIETYLIKSLFRCLYYSRK